MKTFEEYQNMIHENNGDRLITSYDDMLKTVMLVTAIDELTMAVRELHQAVLQPIKKPTASGGNPVCIKELSDMIDLLRSSRQGMVVVDDDDTEE